MESSIEWVEVGELRLGFDLQQCLDLRHVHHKGFYLEPHDEAPALTDPIIARALQGFLFTCGADHIRQPWEEHRDQNTIRWPLHGTLPRTPAAECRVTPREYCHEVSGTIDVAHADGSKSQLRRSYRLFPNEYRLELCDELVNVGHVAFPPMLMYHLNIGGKLLSDQTCIQGSAWDPEIPQQQGEHKECGAAPDTIVIAPLKGPVRAMELTSQGFPFLQVWHMAQGLSRVISIEPATHDLAPRRELERTQSLKLLHPKETLRFKLTIAMTPNEEI